MEQRERDELEDYLFSHDDNKTRIEKSTYAYEETPENKWALILKKIKETTALSRFIKK